MSRRFAFFLCITLMSVAAAAPPSDMRANPDRMEQRIKSLSTYGANSDGGVDRVAFSEADLAGREYIRNLMREAGLTVRMDTAGNIIGRREGSDLNLPVIMFGSHIDSVPGGGNYDGDVGVIGAIEVAQLINDNDIRTRHPLEVVSFTDEEGGLVGSRAMIGEIGDTTLGVTSHSGLTIGEGIRAVGGDPNRLELAERKPGELKAFIELHIEQGAILHEENIDIGIVEGIVGIRWWDVTIEGLANHAGTTPMNRRWDAMVTAAEYILAVNRGGDKHAGRASRNGWKIACRAGRTERYPGRGCVEFGDS